MDRVNSFPVLQTANKRWQRDWIGSFVSLGSATRPESVPLTQSGQRRSGQLWRAEGCTVALCLSTVDGLNSVGGWFYRSCLWRVTPGDPVCLLSGAF